MVYTLATLDLTISTSLTMSTTFLFGQILDSLLSDIKSPSPRRRINICGEAKFLTGVFKLIVRANSVAVFLFATRIADSRSQHYEFKSEVLSSTCSQTPTHNTA